MKFRIHLEAVLSPDCSFEKVKQAFDAQGWTWVQSIPAEKAQFHEEIWLVDDDRGAARYIQDHFLDVTIIRTESNLGGMVAVLKQQLEPMLPLHEIDELVDMSSSTEPGIRAFALRGMAAISPKFYGDVYQALKGAALDPDPTFRGLSLKCISRYPWFQFIKVLEEAASKETVDDLRTEQLALAEDIRKHGKRGI